MNIAPETAANVPIGVIPPEVPAGTRRPLRIDRGSPPYSVPISVAHVSAADAASEPAPSAIQRASGRIKHRERRAGEHRAVGEHLDRVALAALGDDRSPFAAPCCARPKRDSALDDTKYMISSAPQFHPAATADRADDRRGDRAARRQRPRPAARQTTRQRGERKPGQARAITTRCLEGVSIVLLLSLSACLMTHMLATVDALLPLSLLEAVRNVDTPSDQFDAEYVDELRNKRLGLSDTVYAQIKRHTEAVRRRQRIGQDEAIALAKLIGRRPDAEAVFRAAGRYMGRESYLHHFAGDAKDDATASVGGRSSARVSSSAEDRESVSQRQRAARRQFSAARGAAFDHGRHRAGRDRLRVLRGELSRAVAAADRQHRRGRARAVRGRGEGTCEWRADWRSFDRNAGME